MPERPLDDVGESLDIAMRVQGPDGAGDQPVVVEHAKRAEAHVGEVVVLIEREVPPGAEPAARRLVDLRVATNFDHGESPSRCHDNERPWTSERYQPPVQA